MHPPRRENIKRVALIAGSTSGIGLAVAKRLAADGFAIAFHSRSSVKAGLALSQSYEGASYTQADFADSKQVRLLMVEVLRHHGRLDVLVNNAGQTAAIAHASLKAATPEIWRHLYEVNVIAPWTLVTEAEAALRRASGANRPSCFLTSAPAPASGPKAPRSLMPPAKPPSIT